MVGPHDASLEFSWLHKALSCRWVDILQNAPRFVRLFCQLSFLQEVNSGTKKEGCTDAGAHSGELFLNLSFLLPLSVFAPVPLLFSSPLSLSLSFYLVCSVALVSSRGELRDKGRERRQGDLQLPHGELREPVAPKP